MGIMSMGIINNDHDDLCTTYEKFAFDRHFMVMQKCSQQYSED